MFIIYVFILAIESNIKYKSSIKILDTNDHMFMISFIKNLL